jgi:hypothetical protein
MSNKLEIAQVTKKELSLVDNNLLNLRQLDFITSSTPDKFKKTRKGPGGKYFTYVSGGYIKKVLNLMFGWNWDFRVLEHKFDLEVGQVYVLGELRCRIPKNEALETQEIVRTQFGRSIVKFFKGTEKPIDIGNDLKAATTDALKKCASELGIASDIYQPEEFKELDVVEEYQSPTDVADNKNTKRVREHISKSKNLTTLERCRTAIQDDDLLMDYLFKWVEISTTIEELEHIQSDIKDEFFEIIIAFDNKKRTLK